jgi:hypothetical protein
MAILTDYQTALRNISYYNSENNPSTCSRTLGFTINDGSLTSNSFTPAITVSAVNDSPFVSMDSTTLAYIENDTVYIDNALSINDWDNDSLASAQISIISNHSISEDTLLFVNQNGICGSYDTANGTLELSGISSLTDYITGLQSIKYINKSDNPSQLTRSISVKVNDGTDNSAENVGSTDSLVLNFNEIINTGSGNVIIYKSADNTVFEMIDVTSAKVTGSGSNSLIVNPDIKSSNINGIFNYYPLCDGICNCINLQCK